MYDREKLTDAMNDVKAVETFLRKQGESWYADILSDAFDALALLREQEPVEPDIGQVADGVYAVCANCRYSLKLLFDANGPKVGGYLPKFCPECGREVKWMPDRVKVIKALAHHKETAVCNGCPYAEDDDTPQGYCPVYDDAITLLREDDSMEDDGK